MVNTVPILSNKMSYPCAQNNRKLWANMARNTPENKFNQNLDHKNNKTTISLKHQNKTKQKKKNENKKQLTRMKDTQI